MTRQPNDNTIASIDLLVSQMNDGNDVAADELVRFMEMNFRGLARKKMQQFAMLRPHVDTDDLMQSSVIRLHQALPKANLTCARDFFGLSAIIIRREAIRFARKLFGAHGHGRNEVRTQRDESEPSKPDLDRNPGPAAIAMCGEQWEHFYAKADALPDELKEVFDLLWVHRLKQQETASILGVADKTVSKRWKKVRSTLGKYIREMEEPG